MKSKYLMGQPVRINIIRAEPNFDRACDAAWLDAASKFGLDENGNLSLVFDFKRTTDSLVVEFKTYKHSSGMGGHCYVYIFEAYVERAQEEGI